MKLRPLRKDHVAIAITAACFGLFLVGINVAWPAAFGVFIAIGGFAGALMVLYEVRLTKRIAQAEFIRDLQSSFASDPNIGELWRKLLMKEAITPADRHLVSSYLTFFETVQLLLSRGILELQLTDDLFRNRFFTAIGDRGIQDSALISHAGAFVNIHNLISSWHEYMVLNGVPIHEGYYSYIRALVEAKGFEICELGPDDLGALSQLQGRVLESLQGNPWLRSNPDKVLQQCLADQYCVGARLGGELVCAVVLFDGGTTEENIQKYLTDDRGEQEVSINLKLVLTLRDFRRFGLGRALVEIAESRAAAMGKTRILCTIHAANSPSIALFKSLGYQRQRSVGTSYGKRDVYQRIIPSNDKRWAR